MAIIWRQRHEVHPNCAPAADYLAFDGGRVIGRLFEVSHGGNAGRWFWTIMATPAGLLAEPLCGVGARQETAAQALAAAYVRLAASPLPMERPAGPTPDDRIAGDPPSRVQ